MNKTVIIYKALYNTIIAHPNGHEQHVKAGEFLAYDTANKERFTLSEQEIHEQYTYVHNDQYVRKTV